MGRLTQVFTIEELAKLDQKQLEILRDALLHEIRTSPEILEILRTRMRPVYNQLTSRTRQQTQ